MKEDVLRLGTCMLCGSSDLRLEVDLPATPPGDHYLLPRDVRAQAVFPLELMRCAACGQCQLHDVVNPDILYGGYTYETSVSLGLGDHFRGLVDDVMAFVRPDAGARVVEIGSNDGTLLGFFKERGLTVLGIDPARTIAERATQRGIPTLAEYFTPAVARRVRSQQGAADIMAANNVLANISELDGVVEGVRELLAPGGVFVFETGYGLDLLRGTLLDVVYHEHLSYFAVRPLQSFFKRHGMTLVHAKRIESKGGSLRCYVQKAGNDRPVQPSVAAMIAEEESFGLFGSAPYQAFRGRIEGVRSAVQACVAAETKAGHKVWGFGASVGVTTLLYFFGVAKGVGCLIDDNPRKIGTLSPGCHIPVRGSAELGAQKPETVLLFAWRYAQPIVKKNRAYLDAGGRFIQVLPEVGIIAA